jgi:predicted metal-binding membrane protein
MFSAMMTVVSPWLAGAILIAAGVYQLTPWKARCLTHCRSPLGFLLSHWRDGLAGAFRMGFGHGVYCFGCCWALMAVLFAVGVMNLAWVAALTILVFVEKVGPLGARMARLTGVALVVLGASKIAGWA